MSRRSTRSRMSTVSRGGAAGIRLKPAERPSAWKLPADLEVLSRPGHGRSRWRECPVCTSHEFRRPTPEGLASEPCPDVVCFGCGVALRAGRDGKLEVMR